MRKTFKIIAPDGHKISATFDGWQWLGGGFGIQPQITLLEPAPPVTHVQNSTTYAAALSAAGYRLPHFGEPPRRL